jgi:hypothetical protein
MDADATGTVTCQCQCLGGRLGLLITVLLAASALNAHAGVQLDH